MKRITISKSVTSLLCILIIARLNAQTLDLAPVYVTENLQQAESRTTGRNSFTITREDIRKLPAHSIDDLLRLVPGIEVQQRGPQGSQSDLVIRGGTFQQVLVVIDGIRLNDPLTGHFSSYIPLLLEDIERIEVIKGTAATIFGPDAVGGVIHVTTRQMAKQEKQHNLSASIHGGSYGSVEGHIRGSVQRGGNYLSMGYQGNKADGPVLRGTRGFFNNRLGTLHWKKLLPNQWNLSLLLARDVRDFNAQNFYTTFLSDSAREQIRSNRQQFILQKQSGRFHFAVLMGGKQLRDIYEFRPAAIPNRNNSELYTADIRGTLRLDKAKGKLTGGVQAIRKTIRSNDRGDHAHWHTGAYALLQHAFKNRLYLTESIRADWDQQYGWALLPHFNAAYVQKGFTLRGSFGKGIRDADFTERYNNNQKPLVTGGNIGNPYLKAERGWNMELGADITLSKSLLVRTTVFRRRQIDLIDWLPLPYLMIPNRQNLLPTGSFAFAQNIGKVLTRGVEMDLSGNWSFSNHHGLKWNSGITLLKTTTDDGKPVSFYLSSHARLIWNTNLQWFGKMGSLSVGGLYKTRNAQASSSGTMAVSRSYFTVNARIEKYVFKQKMGLRLQVDNFTNTKYADLLGAFMPGRWWQAGVWLRL